MFLAGWHDHDELPDIFAASDVVVLPSVREQFGQVLVEGMACGLPAIAVAAHGPSEIVADGQTGWLVPPDDEEALAAALVMAVNDAPERRRRGTAAYAAVRALRVAHRGSAAGRHLRSAARSVSHHLTESSPAGVPCTPVAHWEVCFPFRPFSLWQWAPVAVALERSCSVTPK